MLMCMSVVQELRVMGWGGSFLRPRTVATLAVLALSLATSRAEEQIRSTLADQGLLRDAVAG